MTKGMTLSAAILAAAFSFAPLAGAQQTPQNVQQREKAAQAAEGANQQMNADEHFLKDAAADNQFEIQAGQFMEKQAQDPQVKQLAQRLVQDHERAQQQLEQVARGLNLPLPTQPEQWQQEKLQAMEQMHGQPLEMDFAFGQVGDHTTDLLKYQYEAEHGQNAQVKQYAEQTIPVLQEHLQLAEQASQQWVPQARTAGERMQGNSGANGTNAPNALKGGSSTNQQGTPSGGANQGINR